ncbi:MAG: hypothetical protein WD077_09885 [Bacteroidia bacterium]
MNRYIRIAIVAGLALWAFYDLMNEQWLIGGLLVFVSLLLALGFLHFSNVWSAFRKFRRGDIESANKILLEIKEPEKLKGANRAYFHFMRGFYELHNDHPKPAILQLQQALEAGIKTEHDRAIAHFGLAGANFDLGRISESRIQLHKAQELPHKENLQQKLIELELLLDQREHGNQKK